jgi:hypothetical protein
MKEVARAYGVYKVECFDKNGILKWKDEIKNLITNEGRQHIIDTVFSAGANVATWFLGLTDGTPTPALGDTLASHAGWAEESGYTGNRQEWVEVRTNQTATNSASVAVFPITGSATIGGGMLASVASGTSGVLMSAGALSGGDRSVINGDTVNLTYSYTE